MERTMTPNMTPEDTVGLFVADKGDVVRIFNGIGVSLETSSVTTPIHAMVGVPVAVDPYTPKDTAMLRGPNGFIGIINLKPVDDQERVATAMIVDECESLSQAHFHALRDRIMARNSADTDISKLIADGQILIEQHLYRQRQQRLKRHGHCGRWDRRYR